MITINDSDRDVLSVIWIDEIKDNPKLQVFRFTRVVFGVSSSPNATNLECYLEANKAIIWCLLQSTYVDDIVTGTETEEAAIELYMHKSRTCFAREGLILESFQQTLENCSNELTMPKRFNPPYKFAATWIWHVQATLHTLLSNGIEGNKILGVLIFDVSELARLANKLHWLPSSSNSYSRDHDKLSCGTNPYLKSWSKTGRT